MARDSFTELDRCSYCGRPAVQHWGSGVMSCRHEVCQGLAYASARAHPAPARRRRLLPQRRR